MIQSDFVFMKIMIMMMNLGKWLMVCKYSKNYMIIV